VLLLEDLLRPTPLPNAAVLMAGGFGTRLRPLTDNVPKPSLSVGGKPLLEILVERLRTAGVQEIFFTVHYKSEMVEAHFGNGARLGMRIRYIREEVPLGLVNGDILTKCDFRAMLDFHRRHRADLTVGTVPHTVEVPYGRAGVKASSSAPSARNRAWIS
jgi:NDP-sugar pyrophosphorylase family protein